MQRAFHQVAVGASSMRLPPYRTPMRSAMYETTVRSWAMKIMVRWNLCFRSIRRLRIWPWIETSRALTTSSHISALGLLISARAREMRWRCPPENSEGLLPRSSALRPTASITSRGPGNEPGGVRGSVAVSGPRGENAKHVHPRVQGRGGILEHVFHVRAEPTENARIASGDLHRSSPVKYSILPEVWGKSCTSGPCEGRLSGA